MPASEKYQYSMLQTMLPDATPHPGETVTTETQQEPGIDAPETTITGGAVEGEAPGNQVQEGSVAIVQSEAALSELEDSVLPAITVGKVSASFMHSHQLFTKEQKR